MKIYEGHNHHLTQRRAGISPINREEKYICQDGFITQRAPSIHFHSFSQLQYHFHSQH